MTEITWFLITKDELDNAVISMAEDDEDYQAEQFYKNIADRKVSFENLVAMIDRRMKQATNSDHLDDLNLIVDELEELKKGGA